MKLIGSHVIAAFFSFLLLFTVLAFPASASVGSANLKVTIIETNPYPAKIGQYLTLTVQVENVGGDKAENVDIRVVPEYPFSLDSSAEAVQNIGALGPGRTATKEVYLFVDKDAKKGTRSIDIYSRPSGSGPWSEETIDIRIGTETFYSKGTVELEEITAEPEVFMPGDRGTVTMTLCNTATTPTVTIDGKDFDTNARIQSAVLETSTEEIHVSSEPYVDMGLLGPGDSIDLTFNVEVGENVRDGTYNLVLAIEGNSFDYSSRKNIPLEVDSSNVRVIPSRPLEMVDGKASLEFDVANTHPNEFSSVSIKPEAKGVEFYPKEYFIGPMDPDELFTIEFEANYEDPGRNLDDSVPTNMSLTASYSNGINRHENVAGNLEFSDGSSESESLEFDAGAALAGGLFALFVPAAFFFYRRKKQ